MLWKKSGRCVAFCVSWAGPNTRLMTGYGCKQQETWYNVLYYAYKYASWQKLAIDCTSTQHVLSVTASAIINN